MPIQQMETTVDLATVERLSAAFNRCFETLDAGDDVFAPDAFFDLYPPLWRFQFQGPDAFAAQLRAIAEGEPSARVLRVVPTATGFVMEHEETQARRRRSRWRAASGCARCATAASPKSSATATAAGTTSCGPATRPKPRCCGRDRRRRDMTIVDRRHDDAAGRPRRRTRVGADHRRPRRRDRSGPPGAAPICSTN